MQRFDEIRSLRLRIHPSHHVASDIMRWMYSRCLHEESPLAEILHAKHFLRATAGYLHLNLLLSFMPNITVLQPQSLRDKIVAMLKEGLERNMKSEQSYNSSAIH